MVILLSVEIFGRIYDQITQYVALAARIVCEKQSSVFGRCLFYFILFFWLFGVCSGS